MFPNSLFKRSFTNQIHLHLCHIDIINTNTVSNRRQIDLGFHCFYLEITWQIHVISCHQRSGNPDKGCLKVSHLLSILMKKFVKELSLLWCSTLQCIYIGTSEKNGQHSRECGLLPSFTHHTLSIGTLRLIYHTM